MEIDEHGTGRLAVLVLSGSLQEDARHCHGMVGERVDRLAAEGKTLVILDLADLEQMDAMGLGEIVGAYRRARARGADLKLLSPPPRVGRLLSVTKLRTIIDVWEGSESPAA